MQPLHEGLEWRDFPWPYIGGDTGIFGLNENLFADENEAENPGAVIIEGDETSGAYFDNLPTPQTDIVPEAGYTQEAPAPYYVDETPDYSGDMGNDGSAAIIFG